MKAKDYLFSVMLVTVFFASCSKENNSFSPTKEIVDNHAHYDDVKALEAFCQDLIALNIQSGSTVTRSGAGDLLDKLKAVSYIDHLGALTQDSTQSRSIRSAIYSLKAIEILFHNNRPITDEIYGEIFGNSYIMAINSSLLPTVVEGWSDSIGVFHNSVMDSVFCDYSHFVSYDNKTTLQKGQYVNQIMVSSFPQFTDTLTSGEISDMQYKGGLLGRLFDISTSFDDLCSLICENRDSLALSMQELCVAQLYTNGMATATNGPTVYMNNALSALNTSGLSKGMKSKIRSGMITGHASYKFNEMFAPVEDD